MATVKGVNKTLIDAAGGPATFVGKGLVDATLRVMYDTYEAAAAANATQIEMGDELPDGAVIVDVQVVADALCGAAGLINVGDMTDLERYCSSLDSSSAGVFALDEIDGKGYRIGTNSADNQIIVSLTGGTVQTGTIKLAVIYAMPA